MPTNHEFTRPDGKTAPAYYIEPAAGADAPGVVVIQEWWGINDQIERVANRLAEAGFRALVPDLYRGDKALDAAEAEHKMTGLDFGDAATQDVRGAVQHLKSAGGRVGTMGFCMGGVLSFLGAMHAPELDAAVAWYGMPPEEAGDPGTIRIPVQGHFGTQDQMFPTDAVNAFEAKLEAAGVTHEFHHYDAPHAFGNEDWDYYDADCAKLAWERSLAFLDKHLR
ncbi:dienelactone hydrolase family protein [Algiphilus sp.]|uniref:dienelactone hydrolase family protein n=1 Tax=Algiphilus sp. TaxID=1872431 RepID=UPI0025C25DA8|nr:dienelactone hydrolase family protein [Algiphilus sp.]MCK5769359.1 dienelactone hydrolase family protein [Algiphilus sp.]